MKKDRPRVQKPSASAVEQDFEKQVSAVDSQQDLPGYPKYAPSEDIYNKFKEEQDIDPENIGQMKENNEMPEMMNEKSFEDDLVGDDLDENGDPQRHRQDDSCQPEGERHAECRPQ